MYKLLVCTCCIWFKLQHGACEESYECFTYFLVFCFRWSPLCLIRVVPIWLWEVLTSVSTSASSGLKSSTSLVRRKMFYIFPICMSYCVYRFSSFCPFSSPLIVDHSGLVTGVAFGENAQFLSSAGMDRSLKFYSL